MTIIRHLRIDDDLQFHSFSLHHTLESYTKLLEENEGYKLFSSPLKLIQRLLVLKILNLRTVEILMRVISMTTFTLTRLEIFDMLRRNLGNFEKTDRPFIIWGAIHNECPAL